MLGTVLLAVMRTIGAIAEVIVLLVVELIVAMLVYIYLNLYHLDTFGYLVRLARYVLDTLTGQLDYWLPVGANAAYATLIGELGPKSILLLLIGLLSGVVVRSVVRLITRRLRSSGSHPVSETA